eukprot:6411116-Prorocentrum_lima.AAC.1
MDRKSLPVVPTPFLVESWSDANLGGPRGEHLDDAHNGLNDLFCAPQSNPPSSPRSSAAPAFATAA